MLLFPRNTIQPLGGCDHLITALKAITTTAVSHHALFHHPRINRPSDPTELSIQPGQLLSGRARVSVFHGYGTVHGALDKFVWADHLLDYKREGPVHWSNNWGRV